MCAACGTRNEAAAVRWVVWVIHDERCETGHQGLCTANLNAMCKCPGGGAFLCAEHRQVRMF
jgi:hypothetical protein